MCIRDSSIGDIVLGLVKQVDPDKPILLTTPYGVGRVDITDVSDLYTDNPLEVFKRKKFVK